MQTDRKTLNSLPHKQLSDNAVSRGTSKELKEDTPNTKPITQTSFCVFVSKRRLASARGTSKSQLVLWILLQRHSYSFVETLWAKRAWQRTYNVREG